MNMRWEVVSFENIVFTKLSSSEPTSSLSKETIYYNNPELQDELENLYTQKIHVEHGVLARLTSNSYNGCMCE